MCRNNDRDKKTKIQLKTNPIMCAKSEMKQAEKEKWLGQQISARGLAESVVQHLDSNIKSDRKLAEQSSKVVCELHSPGATKHTCACPHLGNWSNRHEAKNMERKVNAYPSHKKPGGTALENKIYNEQRKEGWPGLAKETKEICKGLNITDVNTTYLTKNEYKSLVNGAIKRKNEEWLRKEAEGKRKCEKKS